MAKQHVIHPPTKEFILKIADIDSQRMVIQVRYGLAASWTALVEANTRDTKCGTFDDFACGISEANAESGASF